MAAPKVLLVQLPNPVGDVVMTTPLLQLLRDSLPQTQIIVAGKPIFEELLNGLNTFDRYLPSPPRQGGWSGLKLQAKFLRQADADCSIILPNSWSSALAARMAGISRRIGRRAHGRAILLSDALPKVGPARAMTRIYLEMLPPLGIPVPSETEAPLPKLAAEEKDRQFLGVAPGAAFGESKIYPLDPLAEAISIAQKRCGLEVRLLGSPAEAALLQKAKDAMLTRNVEVQIQEPGDFRVAKECIAQCRVLLTMDSGARHIAAALQIPQVVLYGPTDPGWSAHSLQLTQILRCEDVECLGCHHKKCPIDHRCMTGLKPAAVATSLLEQLELVPSKLQARRETLGDASQ